MAEQYTVFAVLILVLTMFIWGKWRYDLVAIMALLFLTLVGIVPVDSAFYGFSHPAVITVVAVLIISRALMNSGLVDSIVRLLSRINRMPALQFAALIGSVTVFSAFMNNIGALALFMSVAIRMARKNKLSPSMFLMPLAFGSLLGGLMTQIGTPPNIIISLFREETATGVPFQMFDFTPVGAGVALAGVLFIVLLGWRFIPRRKGQLAPEDLFAIDNYLTELYIPADSKYAGKRLKELGQATEGDIVVVGHIRNKKKLPFLSPYRIFEPGDQIIIKANTEELKEFLDVTGLKLAVSEKLAARDLQSEDAGIVEAVVSTNSVLENQTARTLNLRSVYGINLLGISREGARLKTRPDQTRFRPGDVLLLQGRLEIMHEVMSNLGCLPLVERGVKLSQPRRVFRCVAILAAALVISAAGLVPIQIAFMTAAVAMLLTGFITLREIYDSIDWPVVVLLGAMIPVSKALETTGGAMTIGEVIYHQSGNYAPWITLTVVMIITILLSNVVNNAAAALLMAPIALSIAAGLGISTDPVLMIVAVGASCAFMTPIGHQSNTLVMGPGGYHFGDYWRLGLPLTVVVTAAAIPLIMMFWPL